jgi:acyl-CoA thioester hydrolase
MEADGFLLPVIEAHCEYRRPARYDEEIEIRTEARLCSAVRLEFVYDVRMTSTNDIAASGRTIHVALNRAGRPCRLPDRIRGVFA